MKLNPFFLFLTSMVCSITMCAVPRFRSGGQFIWLKLAGLVNERGGKACPEIDCAISGSGQ